MNRKWKTLVIALAIAALGLSVVAVAYGATRSARTQRARAACRTLMNDPQALQAMQQLRAEHQKDMQAWRDKYGSDPTSAEAQAALQQLRQEHWSDMQKLFQQFGVKVPKGAGPGACGGGMMGGNGPCGGSAGSPGAGCAGPGSSSGTSYGGGMMGGSYGGGMMGGATY